jgi:hypothetical protein
MAIDPMPLGFPIPSDHDSIGHASKVVASMMRASPSQAQAQALRMSRCFPVVSACFSYQQIGIFYMT